MSKEEQMIETVKQYNDGAIECHEMFNKLFEIVGSEANRFWAEMEAIDRIHKAIKALVKCGLTIDEARIRIKNHLER